MTACARVAGATAAGGCAFAEFRSLRERAAGFADMDVPRPGNERRRVRAANPEHTGLRLATRRSFSTPASRSRAAAARVG
jgi:hypothetical protein